MRRLFDRLLAAYRSFGVAVDAKAEITNITSTTKTVVVAVPQANRTRIIPIGAVKLHNAQPDDACTPSWFVDDNGSSEKIFQGPSMIPDANAQNTFIVVLQPTQALEIQLAGVGSFDLNVHASFLEHRPSS